MQNSFQVGKMLRKADATVRHADGRIQIGRRMKDQSERAERGVRSLMAALAKHRDHQWSSMAAELLELAHKPVPEFMVPRLWL